MRCERTIGGIKTSSPIWLAPLAGVSGRTFRQWHMEQGAGLAHTEMVSAIGLLRGGAKTGALLAHPDEKYPLALQLFSPESESLISAAERAIRLRPYDALEINMACPMPKVTKRGCGAALLDDPERAADMTASLAKIGLPVWIKIRTTGDSDRDRCFCDMALRSGVDLVFIHGRTPEQRYEGIADKTSVAALAAEFKGRIAASGDVWTPDDARYYLDSGCVAVLAARGAVRDAFLIPAVNAALGLDHARQFPPPTIYERASALLRIGAMAVEHEGERHALVLIRRMLGGVWRGIRGAAEIRHVLASYTSWHEMADMIERAGKDVVLWQSEQ